jgi:hypothetical protein
MDFSQRWGVADVGFLALAPVAAAATCLLPPGFQVRCTRQYYTGRATTYWVC